MKQFCENPLCENRSVKEVAVSVRKHADQKRALCAACEEAYTWGVQYSKMSIQKMKVWVLAIADKGFVVHARAFNSKKKLKKHFVSIFAVMTITMAQMTLTMSVTGLLGMMKD